MWEILTYSCSSFGGTSEIQLLTQENFVSINFSFGIQCSRMLHNIEVMGHAIQMNNVNTQRTTLKMEINGIKS
jgi:hypothetical protein